MRESRGGVVYEGLRARRNSANRRITLDMQLLEVGCRPRGEVDAFVEFEREET